MVPALNKTHLVRAEPIVRQRNTAHLIGACGSGMRALAELLTGWGWTISGSDMLVSEATAAEFQRRGWRIHSGHQSGSLPEQTEVVVYSSAVGRDNPERQHAEQLGIPQLSYSQMLGRLMRDREGICIAGTHGKSTTTAMTGWILESSGSDPSVVVGAELRGRGTSGRAGAGRQFVVESCEYERSFLDLSPRHAAILSIEPDHFDCYPHFDETLAAFAAFTQKVPADGSLLISACGDAARAACVAARAPVETFGLSPEADWWATDIRHTTAGQRFRIFRRGEYFCEVSLQQTGRHNVLNALAAAAVAHRAGTSPAMIRESLAEFPGLKRRFEPLGTWRGIQLFDDYAHHPTAVATTLAATRERFPKARICCVFQPHQISRTRALFEDFANSLLPADLVLLTSIYAARERTTREADSLSCALAERIVELGGQARFVGALDRAVATLDDGLLPGDVLLTLGAGDIGRIHHEFHRRLQRYSPAG